MATTSQHITHDISVLCPSLAMSNLWNQFIRSVNSISVNVTSLWTDNTFPLLSALNWIFFTLHCQCGTHICNCAWSVSSQFMGAGCIINVLFGGLRWNLWCLCLFSVSCNLHLFLVGGQWRALLKIVWLMNKLELILILLCGAYSCQDKCAGRACCFGGGDTDRMGEEDCKSTAHYCVHPSYCT